MYHGEMRIITAFLLGFFSLPLGAQAPLQLTFTGDLMAYKKNQEMPQYQDIYRAIQPVLAVSDLNFINVESPLDPRREQLSYPSFNAHPGYLEAAIQSGFNIFSVANNHANDYGLSSIMATRRVLEQLHQQYPMYWSGYKNYPSEPIKPTIIWKNGWKVGFVALTNIVNVKPGSDFLYYFPTWSIWDDGSDKAAEAQLLDMVRTWKSQVDLLVVSLHDGIEYEENPSKVQVRFYTQLVKAGVDILWGTHPHRLQPWAWVDTERGKRIILFSMGNFLTYQQFKAKKPEELLSFGGDGALWSITARKTADDTTILCDPQITLTNNYDDPQKAMVVKPTSDLMKLPKPWGKYYGKRWALQQFFLKPWYLK